MVDERTSPAASMPSDTTAVDWALLPTTILAVASTMPTQILSRARRRPTSSSDSGFAGFKDAFLPGNESIHMPTKALRLENFCPVYALPATFAEINRPGRQHLLR